MVSVRFDRTYEELKLEKLWDTHDWAVRFDRTYEELKLFIVCCYFNFPIIPVLIVPMRN